MRLLVRLRQQKLLLALQKYPIYSPPHRTEERLLTKTKAEENFDYFMTVRNKRLEFFTDWLHRYFSVSITPNEAGIRKLSRWGNGYAGFLCNARPLDLDNPSFFTYQPVWENEYLGCNVVFDISIAFGEFVIANCPRLRWELDPISVLCPHEAKILKSDFGSGFQRPVLTGCLNPAWYRSPFLRTASFVSQMAINTIPSDRIKSLKRMPPGIRNIILDELTSAYLTTLRDYSEQNSYIFLDKDFLDSYLQNTEAEAERAGKDYE